MEDIQQAQKKGKNELDKEMSHKDGIRDQQQNQDGQLQKQVSKQDRQRIEKADQEIIVSSQKQQIREGYQQQGNQLSDFDKFEDYNQEPSLAEVEGQNESKQSGKQEALIKGQNERIANTINQKASQKLSQENVQMQQQKQKNIQNPNSNQNQVKKQNKCTLQQSIPISTEPNKSNIEQNGQQSPKKNQLQQNEANAQKSNTTTISGSIVLRQAEKQRIGSIFQNFRSFNLQYEEIIASYKLVIKNVISQLKLKATYKSNLQNTLTEYFQNYSKIHREFDQRVFKLAKASKQESTGDSNKYLNMKQYLKSGFQELNQLRKNIGMNNQKLDGYINNYVINSIKQVFEDYRAEISGEERRQISQKQDFIKQEKSFKKVIENLDKLCKKSIQGVKTSEDIFIQLSNYINRERQFRKALIRYGKTVIQLRKNYISLQIKLFEKLQKILNQFKNQQKMVYVAAKQFNFIQDFTGLAQENAKYQNLCTITDADYIKGVLKLQNRKERTKFQNHHFEQYLQMPFIDPFIAEAKKMLKGAIKKSFPMKKANCELVHSISQNLIQYQRQLNECQEKMVIKHVNANIIGQGAIEFSEMVKKVIFTEHRTIRMQLQNSDRAEELISYLNEMQQLNKN